MKIFLFYFTSLLQRAHTQIKFIVNHDGLANFFKRQINFKSWLFMIIGMYFRFQNINEKNKWFIFWWIFDALKNY